MLTGKPLRLRDVRRLEDAMTSMSSLLERAAAEHPDNAALRMDDLVLTYAQLREAAGRMSTLLGSLGVEPGDRVGLMLPSVPDRLLRRAGRRRRGGADEPAAQEPRGQLLPG